VNFKDEGGGGMKTYTCHIKKCIYFLPKIIYVSNSAHKT